MLFIDNDTVKQTLSIADSIDSQDRAFRGLVDGGSIHRPRIDVYVPTGREEDYYRWGTMEGASRDLGVFAIRMKSDVVSWPEDASGNWTEEKYCVEPGTYCGLIMLFSTVNGEPLAMINDGYLQHMRVGAGAGLGVRYLAREDSQRRGDARLRRHGAQLPGSVLQRAAHHQGAGLQPHEGAPGGLRRRDERRPERRH